jgi:hypothetical protein
MRRIVITALIAYGCLCLAHSKDLPKPNTHDSLRNAIENLISAFPTSYPHGADYLKRLDSLQPNDETAFRELQREALLANPLVCSQPILFVTRNQYRSHYHAIDTLFHTDEFNWDKQQAHDKAFGPNGSLKTLDVKTGKTTTLLEFPEGVARDPDLHYDGQQIVLAVRRSQEENYHICRINVDGSGFEQLTHLADASDFDPVYLPDDSIVFASTREPKYNMCSRDHGANLFRMDSDGANIHRITRNTLFDNHPEVMPDGRILYARWEYVDRNFGDAHGIWVVNPDGTGQSIFWGNNTTVPGAIFNQHVIQGTDLILGILGQHHDRLWGALTIVDRLQGLDGPAAIRRTWPPEAKAAVRIGGHFDCDAFHRFSPKYEDPWPLNQNYFLCSRQVTGKDDYMGIYLLDIFGNEILLHAERPGCYDPIPLKSRQRPPVLQARRKFDGSSGLVYIQDVYQGSHMQNVKRGVIKYVRVVESPTKKNWSGGSWGGQGYQAPGMNWHDFTAKRIIGIAPVEPDGSAYIEVPSDTFIYFQVLDENKMMVQSMRSGTVVQPGETQSCVGCHENRDQTPVGRPAASLALKRAPSKLRGWMGKSTAFSFMRDVQPVFNQHCVKCHDFGKDAGKRLILAADRNPYFNAAYIDLWIWNRKMIKCIGGGPAEIQPAYSWGSHPSRLSQVLRGDYKQHQDLELSREDLERINTWLDLNAPYYPYYECAYPDSPSGRSPLTHAELQRLGQLCELDFNGRLKNHGRVSRAQICFERPELSPCLARIPASDSPARQEALEIITLGAKRLRQTPRCDMANFRPCPKDLERLALFDRRDDIERQFRKAIREKTKLYDKDIIKHGMD